MKKCFLICPIGEEESPARRRSDQLLAHILKPLLEAAGYEAQRADLMPMPGMITTQIVRAIDAAELVIADLTGANANVFYELAIRHATGKPYIQIIKAGENIPFDVHGVRTIQVDLNDLDAVEKAKRVIAAQIQAIEKGHAVDSPVYQALTENLLASDSNIVQVFLEKFWSIEESIEHLSREISAMPESIEEKIKDAMDSVKDEIVDEIVKELPSDI